MFHSKKREANKGKANVFKMLYQGDFSHDALCPPRKIKLHLSEKGYTRMYDPSVSQDSQK